MINEMTSTFHTTVAALLNSALQGEYSTTLYGQPGMINVSSLRIIWLSLLPPGAQHLIGRLGMCVLHTRYRELPFYYPHHVVYALRSFDPEDSAWVGKNLGAPLSKRDAVLANFSWTEVTHCASNVMSNNPSAPLADGRFPAGGSLSAELHTRAVGPAWLYVAPGSGASVNIGNSVALPFVLALELLDLIVAHANVRSSSTPECEIEHDAANNLNTSRATGPGRYARAAAALGLSIDSIQIEGHKEVYSAETRHEVVLLRETECAEITSMRSVRCGHRACSKSSSPSASTRCREAVSRIAHCHNPNKFSAAAKRALRTWPSPNVDCKQKLIRSTALELLRAATEAAAAPTGTTARRLAYAPFREDLRQVDAVVAYLRRVYPAIGWAGSKRGQDRYRPIELHRLYHERLHSFYGGRDADAPRREGVLTNATHACVDGHLNEAVLRRVNNQHRFPPSLNAACNPGAPAQLCVRALFSARPDVPTTQAARGLPAPFAEVTHLALNGHGAAAGMGWSMRNVRNFGARMNMSWADFLDSGNAGWWYLHTPGSGVFYHTGRTRTATFKNTMMIKLLEQALASAPATATMYCQPLGGVDAAERLLSAVRATRDAPCSALLHCRGSHPQIVLDDMYDHLLIRLGRALGFDTLYFRSSPLDFRGNFIAELVDLRLPSAAEEWPQHFAWPARSADNDRGMRTKWHSRLAASWVAEMNATGVGSARLTLRDPLRPAVEDGVLPCVLPSFATLRLACVNHEPSWPQVPYCLGS